jgi:dual specificity tyrosine-phosphorylation-regulated kinase 2/3/4
MRRFADLLTPFEQSEVLEYQQVYFVGQPGVPKIKGIPHTANNNGYDDERGDYKVVQSDHLEYRYEVLGLLGRGSFGQVYHCIALHPSLHLWTYLSIPYHNG